MNLKKLLKTRDGLNLRIENYFDHRTEGPLIDCLEQYWVDDGDCLWVADSHNDLVQLNYIARWDGSSWFPVLGGLNAKGYSLCFDAQGSLYVGGEFTMAGNVNCNCIAKLEKVCTNCF